MGSNDDSPEVAELSALADGTIDPARVEHVRARIAASPELTVLYERERKIVGLLHEARSRDRAPAALRERIDRDSAAPARPARRTGWGPVSVNRWLGGLVAAAVVVVALVLILPAGTPGSPSVSQAASLAVRAATAPAPGVDPDRPTKLGTSLQNVYFPNWMPKNGWKAVGQRRDRIDGRPATTVFYAKGGVRVAYTIVGAPALKVPTNGRSTDGFVNLTLNGRQVVTWRDHNKTCVLSAAGSMIPGADLVALAEQN
jgi:anti-sigma factor RsiW